MYDLSTLAQSDLGWMSVALTDVRKRVNELKKELVEKNPINKHYFMALEKILEMYEFIAEEREKDYISHAEKYNEELEDEGQA